MIESFYVAVPECPGHQHPLKPALHEGLPSWVCPADAAHHVEPILPGPPGGCAVPSG